jgi:Lon protease-like protein
VVLPLHVFEERYRILFAELLDGSVPRRFGVVAIRRGLEVEDRDPVLHEIGCVAEIRRADRFADGRYDVVTSGGPRFLLRDVDDTRPYLRGTVDYLPEETGDGAGMRAATVLAAFGDYCRAVAEARDEEVVEPDLPADDPVLVSYVVAAAMRLDLPEKQALLAVPDASTRLRRELSLLRREVALLNAAPDTVPTEGPFSLN